MAVKLFCMTLYGRYIFSQTHGMYNAKSEPYLYDDNSNNNCIDIDSSIVINTPH